MLPKKVAYQRKLVPILAALSIAFLLILLNGSIISAQVTTQPSAALRPSSTNRLVTAEADQTNSVDARLPTLDVTQVATIYLPIVYQAPAPSISLAPNCNPSGGSGGLKPGTYDTTVAGLKAIVVVGQGYSPSRPTYLGFNIHGDGGNYDALKNSSNPLRQLANQRGWILVSPRSPNGNIWWKNWRGDHNQALANVFEAMFAKYNLCRNVIFGTTGSGGSEFWTSHFFPAKGSKYPAHTVIACGGNDGTRSARTQIINLGKNSNIIARSTFYYVYGTKDKLVPLITDSIETYRLAGFRVEVKKLEGAGHCNVWKKQGLPTWHEQAANIWVRMAQRLGAN